MDLGLGLEIEWQRNAATVPSGQIACNQQFQGSQPLAAVGLRLGFPAQGLDHVLVNRR